MRTRQRSRTVAVAWMILLFLAPRSVLAQSDANQVTNSGKTPGTAEEITVDGCLYGGQGNFNLVNADDYFELRGDLSALNKYIGDEVQVRGKLERSDRGPSILVSGATLAFKAPQVQLSRIISDPGNWHFQTTKLYGVRFALAAIPENATGGGYVSANFVSETGTVTLGALPIPEEIYPGTNFVGGNFLLSVNPEIQNRESCEKFGASEPRFLSHSTFGGMRYTKLTAGDAGLGTSYEELYFHTFQNGMCYEVAFSFGEYDTSNQDLGCRVGRPGDTNVVVEEFMRRISYLPSKAAPTAKHAAPKVISFTASSTIVDASIGRRTLQFSWTSKDTDYIELSYQCSAYGSDLIIQEDGGSGGRNCENDPKPIEAQTEQLNHPPNSDIEVTFGNFHHQDPISIDVRVTPFSHGKAYSAGSKTIAIRVDPDPPPINRP